MPPGSSTIFGTCPLLRQTPGSLGIWGGHQFLVNQNVEHCDAWIVLEGLDKPESTICPPEKVILLAAEPRAIKTYHKKWLSQFSAVSSYQKNIVPCRLLKRNPSLPWWVGRSYDELVASPFPEKKRLVSSIFSAKKTTSGHRRRKKVLEEMAKDGWFEPFGRAIRPVADKWDALYPYKYSVVVENSFVPHYWTEKIADCFLAGTVPIYYGCPNLEEYFPEKSFIRFDLHHPETLKEIISKLRREDDYHERIEALNQSKAIVLGKQNIFQTILDCIEEAPKASTPVNICLAPEPKATKWQKRWHSVKNHWRSLLASD
jgi:hypothetical protein